MKKQSKGTRVKLLVQFIITVPKEQAKFYKEYEQAIIDNLAGKLSYLLINKPFAKVKPLKLEDLISNE